MITITRTSPDRTEHCISIRGHQLVTDLSVAEGGADAGPTPHDLYDAALGACKALTMIWYAQRNAIALDDVNVAISRDASAERQGTYRLTARIAVTGDMTDDQRAKLIAMAAKCPVHKLMTEVTTVIETIGVDPARFAD